MSQLVWVAVTRYHSPGGLNNRNLFFTVLEPGMSEIRVPACSASGGALFSSWFTDGHLLAVSSQSEEQGKRKQGLLCLSYKGTHPVHEGSVLMTYSPPPSPNSIRMSTNEFRGDTNIQTVARRIHLNLRTGSENLPSVLSATLSTIWCLVFTGSSCGSCSS